MPKDRARLMIGDGRIGLADEDAGDDAGLEEIELPYADGEDEEMEEISSSKFLFLFSERTRRTSVELEPTNSFSLLAIAL